jgi:hypothetical protein
MAHIKVDSEKIAGRKVADLSQEELQGMMLDTEESVIEEVKAGDSTLTLGAIGGSYSVGPIDFTMALGNLVLLNEIDSPFATGEVGEEGSEVNAIEYIKSLYVLAEGKAAVKPVMAIKQRVQDMLMLKPMVEKNPDLFEKLMDRVETISEAHTRFETDAIEWYEANFAGFEFQDVINSVFVILNDVMKVAGDMPSSSEKKKQSEHMTTTGQTE